MATIRRLDDTQAEFAEGTLVGVQATATPSLTLAYRPVLSFDGVDDYVDIPASSVFNVNNLTIEGYVKLITYNNRIDSLLRVEGQSSWLYELANYNGGINFFIHDGTTSYECIGSKPPLNVYKHWACTYDGSTMKVYLDGILENSVSYTGGINMITTAVYIAKVGTYYTNAQIFELRVWNTARTQQQIQDNMNKRLTGTETGLIAYYKLDEGTGTIATDSAGTNNGTIYGATWTTSSSFYMSSGYRVTPNLDLTQENIILNSNIKWTANLNLQTIVIEARTSTDGGTTWSAWQTCTNNAPIPGIQPNSLLQIRQSLATTDMSTTPELTSLDIVIETAAGSISGTVTEEGANVQRTIRAYLRSDGHLVDEVTSNTDGTFTLYTATLDEHYVVALDDTSDATDYNALIFDRITPGSA